jgi:hypothetical protein
MPSTNRQTPQQSRLGVPRDGHWSRVFVALLLCGVCPAVARADGGTLRLSEQQGDYRISVFTAPTPWRVGPVDVSVLVQDATTGDPLPDVVVTIGLDRPGASLLKQATAGAATNRLFQAAEFELPDSGRWQIDVSVRGPRGTASCSCAVVAGEPLPSWLRLSPWIAWPAGVVLLFGIHQFLVRRRQRTS